MAVLDINAAMGRGTPLRLDENNNLKEATWLERNVFRFGKDAKKDVELALISKVFEEAHDPQAMKRAEKYGKMHSFEKLENVAFAHRIAPLFKISVESLIDREGNLIGDSLPLLKRNHLHRIIPDVDLKNTITALIEKDDALYIRSEEGVSFLDSCEDISLLLRKLDTTHPHKEKLARLLMMLHTLRTGNEAVGFSETDITVLQEELAPHYTYQLLADVPHDTKGTIKEMFYLAHGISKHSQRHFKELRETHREEENTGMYTFTVVTRLPSYAKEPNFWKRLCSIITNLFNRGAHGHSWIELSAPDKEGDLRSSVGYYFHVLTKERRFQSPDPQTFTPIPKELLIRESIEINESQFQKAKMYIEEVQKMLDRKDKRIGDMPLTEGLSEHDRKEIAFIYNQALKATCLSFANSLRKSITGVRCDDRSATRRVLLPEWLLRLSDEYFNPILRVTNLGLLAPLSWIMRAEFPAYRAGEITPGVCSSGCSGSGQCHQEPQAAS